MIAGDVVEREREFRFTDEDFRRISSYVEGRAGIRLTDAKRDMVYSRVSRRLRELGLTDFGSYLELITDDDSGAEAGKLINAITTNLTSFFREPHHFEFLKEELVPRLLQRNAERRRIRIWSAGCSTGEEPYSIAMVLAEAIPGIQNWDVRVLATDLDSDVLARAHEGVYSANRIEGVPAARVQAGFFRGRGRVSGLVKVRPELQRLVAFRQLNLLGPWPFHGPFDAIFCRNVVIYFSKEVQRTLFDRFAGALVPDGHLFIGHSETLFKVSDRFRLLGNTIYQRIA